MIPFKLNKLSILVGAVSGTFILASSPIHAAQSDKAQQEMEAITVTGYRFNLARSKDLKKMPLARKTAYSLKTLANSLMLT